MNPQEQGVVVIQSSCFEFSEIGKKKKKRHYLHCQCFLKRYEMTVALKRSQDPVSLISVRPIQEKDAPMAFNSMYNTEGSLDHVRAFPAMCLKLSAIQQKYSHLNIWKVFAFSELSSCKNLDACLGTLGKSMQGSFLIGSLYEYLSTYKCMCQKLLQRQKLWYFWVLFRIL